jgi:hypothetical protein
MLDVSGYRHELTAEVRAARLSLYADAFYWEARVRMEELRQHALDFHARRVPMQLDAVCGAASHELAQFPLQVGVGCRGVKIWKEVEHLNGRRRLE